MGRIIQHEIASSISPEADNHKLWYLAKNVPVRYLRQVNKSDVSKLFLSHVSNFCLFLLTFTKKWLVVKVIHHIVSAEVHRLARELLDPEPEKKGGESCLPGWRLEREEDVFFFFFWRKPHLTAQGYGSQSDVHQPLVQKILSRSVVLKLMEWNWIKK